jgi:alkanesulfonate monooxygenase SsuD/methylene tetrahydromethanopterin reductase-like flavin-dependent oxidoreductase (luciferase family)
MKTRYAIADLGVYVLPGRVTDPRPGIAQAISAERAGFGSVWVAERWDRKEIGVVCGALGQATSRIRVVAGMTHFGSRHPIVLAGLGTTMQTLTGGRFRLGIARSSPQQWANLGLEPPSNAA